MRICRMNFFLLVLLIVGAAMIVSAQPAAAAGAKRTTDHKTTELPTPRPGLKSPKPNAWPFTAWSYAKAYTYNFSPEPANILQVVDSAGTWNSRLRSEQLISEALAVKASGLVVQSMGTFETTKCTIPRHAVVLFDRVDKPVAAASVCFDCEGILVWPDYDRPDDAYHAPGKYEAAEAKFMAALKEWKVLFRDELGLPVDYRTPQ